MVAIAFAAAFLLSIQPTDTLLVDANNPPVWGEGVRLVEELRIGSLDGPEEYAFGSISGLAIGPDGTVFIADGQVPIIRQYGRDGEYLRDIGGEGEGPGEYRSVYGMRMLRNSPLAILDPRAGRVTRYVDGEYSTSFRSLSSLHAADLFAVDTAGFSYVKTVLRDAKGGIPSGETQRFAWIRFDDLGAVVDTLIIPPEDSEGGGFSLAGRGGYFRPFTVMTVSTLSPHGYLVECRNEKYSIFRPLPDGRTLEIRHHTDAVPVGPEEREQWEAWRKRFEGPSRAMGLSSELGSIPHTKPFVRHLYVDDDGRIWVAVYAEARFKPYSDAEREERGDRPSFEWNQPLVWDVLDPRGRFLGRVTLPDKTSLVAARGNTVWGVQAGDFGEDNAIRFRISPQ